MITLKQNIRKPELCYVDTNSFIVWVKQIINIFIKILLRTLKQDLIPQIMN